MIVSTVANDVDVLEALKDIAEIAIEHSDSNEEAVVWLRCVLQDIVSFDIKDCRRIMMSTMWRKFNE